MQDLIESAIEREQERLDAVFEAPNFFEPVEREWRNPPPRWNPVANRFVAPRGARRRFSPSVVKARRHP